MVGMLDHMEEIIKGFPEVITGSVSTPFADHWFKVREEKDTENLPEEQAGAIHRTVA